MKAVFRWQDVAQPHMLKFSLKKFFEIFKKWADFSKFSDRLLSKLDRLQFFFFFSKSGQVFSDNKAAGTLSV